MGGKNHPYYTDSIQVQLEYIIDCSSDARSMTPILTCVTTLLKDEQESAHCSLQSNT